MKIQKDINSTKLIQKFIFVFVLIYSFSGYCQFEIPKVPDFQTSVYDYAKVLSSSEKSQLEEKLIRYSDSTSTQIVVITIESLKGESIGLLAPKWAQEWGIGGSKDQDNGVIILVAKDEHKVWISPGYGVEDRLTAGITGELVREFIIPEFKAGSYFKGLDKGSDAIFDVLKGKYKATKHAKKKGGIKPIAVVIIVIIVIIFLSRRNRGGGSGIGHSPSLLDVIILSNLGSSGGFGGGGSSGGGGFGGGFGGGGFSGGGAGGSW